MVSIGTRITLTGTVKSLTYEDDGEGPKPTRAEVVLDQQPDNVVIHSLVLDVALVEVAQNKA